MKLDRFKLFGIDIQNDFITGSLAVPGAPQDVRNITQLVSRLGGSIDSIFLTVDTHPVVHIGHPGYWKDAKRQACRPAWAAVSRQLDVSMGRRKYGEEDYLRGDRDLGGPATLAGAQRCGQEICAPSQGGAWTRTHVSDCKVLDLARWSRLYAQFPVRRLSAQGATP